MIIMSVKDQKEIISELLKSLFGKEDKVSFYFMKKGKTTSQDEAIIPYKTRTKIDSEKIREVEIILQKKTGEFDLRLIRWSDVIGKIVPASRVFKIPFFDSTDVTTKSHPWRLCPGKGGRADEIIAEIREYYNRLQKKRKKK